MLFSNYKTRSLKRWNDYFSLLRDSGFLIEPSEGCVTLFPTHILFMDCGDQYGMELIGASKSPQKLQPRVAKYDDIHKYFNTFKGRVEGGAAFSLGEGTTNFPNKRNAFSNLLISQGGDTEAAKRRFGFVSDYQTVLCRSGGQGSLFHFNSKFVNVTLSNCGVLNHENGIFRGKKILFLGIHGRSIMSDQLENFFRDVLGFDDKLRPLDANVNSREIQGVATVKSNSIASFESSMLQNVALSGGMHETTIDEYLAKHPNILQGLFNSEKVIHNATLKWIEHEGDVEEKSIKPDAFIMRSDGYFDIADFKLAATERKSLTKGKHSRRRFIEYVNEGLAQLAHYQSYFDYEGNAKYALDKYGIRVRKPGKVLVVGSLENADPEQIRQALRAYDSSYSIVDYDAIAIGHRSSAGIL